MHLPFQSFNSKQYLPVCPKCGKMHADIETRYCTITHLPGHPDIDATTVRQSTVEHLHRTCRLCRYEWTEHVADASLGPKIEVTTHGDPKEVAEYIGGHPQTKK